MDDIFVKLKNIEKKHQELTQKIIRPEIVNDKNKYKELMIEYKGLTDIVNIYKQYKTKENEYNEAKEIINDSKNSDKEFIEMAQVQYTYSKEEMEKIKKKLKVMLMPKDPNDNKNTIIEIRGGAGGEEASLFAGDLFRMYTMYAEKKGFKVDVLSSNEKEKGGYKEISFEIVGDGAYSHFKYEKGVHRVQRVPKTESQGRVHTSTVTVAVLPEIEEVEFEVNPSDVEVATFRASGAGGQKVNKTESAIRLTHIPTGVVVECQDERSQYQNKFKAMKILRSRLYEQAQSEADAKLANERKQQVGTGDRSERIRTYNFPQGRVSDHRIGLTLYTLEHIMDGELDELTENLKISLQIESQDNR